MEHLSELDITLAGTRGRGAILPLVMLALPDAATRRPARTAYVGANTSVTHLGDAMPHTLPACS
jgi:hypothetical protein